jgi:TolB-like protein/Tfp pilus assembly protein PilF
MPGLNGFLDELRKRGVIRAALIYAAAAFAVLEFADIAFPRLGLPDNTVDVVLWLGIAGFPLALFAAWAIEVRAVRDTGRTTRWLSPASIATAAGLVVMGVAMAFWWGGVDEAALPGLSPRSSATAARNARGPALAVLRFADLSGSDELFAVGLSEEIATVLSGYPGFRVISPRATAYFDEAAGDIQALDDQFGVQYLLRGTVQRSADRVRVAAQLIDASSGDQLWGDRYDAELVPAQLFDTQDEIALRVASTIGDSSGVLVQLAQRELRGQVPESLEAYECVLLGQAYLIVHTAEVHREARACLARAVELDPDYAAAWAHLAYMYREEYLHRYPGEPKPLERAAAAARRAIDLDPNSAMAHFAMAFTLSSQYRTDAAVMEMERVVALSPNDSAMLGGMSILLAISGRWDRALEVADQIEELNPLQNGWVHYTRAMAHYRVGEFEEALAEVIQLNRNDIQTQIHLAAIYARLGRTEAARAAAQELLRMDAYFAADPSEYLRRVFHRDVTIERYAKALRLAGVEIEIGKPARILR